MPVAFTCKTHSLQIIICCISVKKATYNIRDKFCTNYKTVIKTSGFSCKKGSNCESLRVQMRIEIDHGIFSKMIGAFLFGVCMSSLCLFPGLLQMLWFPFIAF